ncbi:MAG: hypothetical protein WDO73_01385 [Ignavibacteriota bacterium]
MNRAIPSRLALSLLALLAIVAYGPMTTIPLWRTITPTYGLRSS